VQGLAAEPGPELPRIAEFHDLKKALAYGPLFSLFRVSSLLFLSFYPYSDYVAGWTTEESKFDSRLGREIFSSS
jgi:hypothetical protein